MSATRAAAQLRSISKQFRNAAGRGLYKHGNIEMTESQKQCPVDTGQLRSTGTVSNPEWSGNTVTVMLSYHAEYALVVHEDLEAFHPVGNAKYLERPIKESAPYMPERVMGEIKKDLGL